jgi:hypothetical protein
MSEDKTTLGRNDPVLLPFLRASEEVEADSSLAQLLAEHGQPVIKGIIRNKLNVTLSASDGRLENQEALEIESDVLAELLMELNELKAEADNKVINNFRSYAAVITFHACSKHLRRKHPQRGQLKDKLRYLLNNRPHFSLWQTSDEQWVCGFIEWRDHKPQTVRAGSQLEPLINSSHKDLLGRPGNGAVMKLEELLPAIFNGAGQPVEFNELVSAIAELQGIKNLTGTTEEIGEEVEKELSQIPDSRPNVAVEVEQRFYLQRLWEEICQLPLRQRLALLLNLKDAQGRSMISMFPLTGIASLQRIAAALEIPPEKFAQIWNDFPWEDAAIAAYLYITRQQVANLRKCARERLARRMKGF